MRHGIFALLLCAGAFVMNAQAYKDGVDYYKIGQSENAKYLLDKNLDQTDTDKAIAYYYLGRIALDGKDANAAKDYFNKGVATNADQPLNYVGLGEIELKAGATKEAESQFKEALSKGKKDATAAVEIARAYYRTDATKYAKQIEECLKKATNMEKKVGSEGYNKNQTEIQIFYGDRYVDQNDPDKACECYDQIVTLFDETNPVAAVKYAEYFYKMNERMAIDKLQTVVDKNPNSAMAKRQLADLYYKKQQYTAAVKLYQDYIQDPNHLPNDEVRYAEILFQAKDYVDAVDQCSIYLKKDPKHLGVKRIRFYAQYKAGDWQDAFKDGCVFFDEIETAPEKYNATDFTYMAEVLLNIDRKDDAIRCYRNIVNIAKNDEEKVDALRKYSEGLNYVQKFKESAAALEELVAIDSSNLNDIYTLSRRYYSAAQADETFKKEGCEKALKYIDIAIEKAPSNIFLYKWKAKYYTLLDTKSDGGHALEAYKEYVKQLKADEVDDSQQGNDFMEPYIYIANYYLGKKNTAEAKSYFQAALECDPSNDKLRQFISTLK